MEKLMISKINKGNLEKVIVTRVGVNRCKTAKMG